MTSLLGLVAVGDFFNGEARLQERPVEHIELCVLLADHNGHQCAVDAGTTRELVEERSELLAFVVHHDHAPVLEAFGDLASDVVVKGVHVVRCSVRPLLALRLRLEPEAGSGASRRLFSAALTAVEVRSRTKSAIGFCGFLLGFHLPSSSSNQKTSSSP